MWRLTRIVVYMHVLRICCYTPQSIVLSSGDRDFLSRSNRGSCVKHTSFAIVSLYRFIGWRCLSRIFHACLEPTTNIRYAVHWGNWYAQPPFSAIYWEIHKQHYRE